MLQKSLGVILERVLLVACYQGGILVGLPLAIVVMLSITCMFSASTIEVCQTQQLEASCDQDEVVVMTSAQYGRMKMTRCVERDYGYMGCATDVMPQSDVICSGKPLPMQLLVPEPVCSNINVQCDKKMVFMI